MKRQSWLWLFTPPEAMGTGTIRFAAGLVNFIQDKSENRISKTEICLRWKCQMAKIPNTGELIFLKILLKIIFKF